MIRSKDLNTEIKALEVIEAEAKDEKLLLKALVKGIALLLKVVRDIKSNQVLGLKKAGVDLIKARTPNKTNSEK